MVAAATQHFGRSFFAINSVGFTLEKFVEIERNSTVPDLLDFAEILAEHALTEWSSAQIGKRQANRDVEKHLNRVFVRHRFGFEMTGGQVRRVGSPALDARIVGPALLSVQKSGWTEAERSFREALHHQRGGQGERDDAITAAHAALEAAMKAAGLEGHEFGELTKSFRKSGLVPPQLTEVPDLLDKLLKRSAALRNTMSDSHGRAPDAEPVPEGVVDLAIYWTGAFINYLADATSA